MKLRRLLSMLIVAALVLSFFTACGESGGSSTGDAGSSKQSSAVSEDKGEDSSAGGEDEGKQPPASDVVNGETNQQSYPIVDEALTLRLWYPMAGNLGELADFNDGEFWQWYEEKTGIHIDFVVPAAGSETDAFNLLFASDDMPDLLYTSPIASTNAQTYRGGEDKAISDGYFIDMAEYLDYAPNYVSWLNNDEQISRDVYSDTGKMYGMWGIWKVLNEDTGVMPELGISIRKDFLDKVNMEVPTTYDEWYTVLKAFKEELGVEIPLYTSRYGIDIFGEFMAGYGTAPYFYQDGGTVKYGPMDDAYKEYLTLLNQWYSEGLLDTDFPTRNSTGYSPDDEVNLNDKVGAFCDWATRLSETYVSRGATNPDYYLVAAEQPTKGDGTTPKYHFVTSDYGLNGHCMLVSADSEHIEEAIRWNDGFYAQDIYLNANYGLEEQEGTVWYAADDGHRIGDYDFRYSNPEGLSSATVLVKYWAKNPPIRVEGAQIEQADDNKQAAYETWAKYDSEWSIPTRTTMTAEESTAYSSIYTDIETYVQECNVKFITGSMSLDTYDSYRDTLREMGIEEAIGYRQAALDRYNAR